MKEETTTEKIQQGEAKKGTSLKKWLLNALLIVFFVFLIAIFVFAAIRR